MEYREELALIGDICCVAALVKSIFNFLRNLFSSLLSLALSLCVCMSVMSVL